MLKELGIEVYNVDHCEVAARGIQIDAANLNLALNGPVKSIIYDSLGKEDLRQMFAGIASTGFDNEILEEMLALQPPIVPSWRIGEALAEVFVTNKHSCEFPWSVERDLKNLKASPAGADLIGFQRTKDENASYRFVFGEVKTSGENEWPPQVSHCTGGLQDQITLLRDSREIKLTLLRYLAYRARNAPWFQMYKSATERYLKSNLQDAAIFGILIRDVEPKEADLYNHAVKSIKGKSVETQIIFNALYLPIGVIAQLSEMLRTIK